MGIPSELKTNKCTSSSRSATKIYVEGTFRPMKYNYLFNCFTGEHKAPKAPKARNISTTYVNVMKLEYCFEEFELGKPKVLNLLHLRQIRRK